VLYSLRNIFSAVNSSATQQEQPSQQLPSQLPINFSPPDDQIPSLAAALAMTCIQYVLAVSTTLLLPSESQGVTGEFEKIPVPLASVTVL